MVVPLNAQRKSVAGLAAYLRTRSEAVAPRIVVLGDVMLDEYMFGTVERISPEAPIPVVECNATSERLGGAGNVAANLRALGASVELVSVSGVDAAGDTVAALAAAAAIASGWLVRSATRPTTRKLRIVASNQQVVRVDFERRHAVEPGAEEQLCTAIDALVPGADAVIVSDYGKGVCTPMVVRHAIAAARSAGIPIVCDPKGTDYDRFRGATLITPNRKEASEALARALPDGSAVETAGRELMTALELDAALITLGADGLMLTQHDASTHISAFAREVADVTGAGDTVIATLTLALAHGMSLIEACLLANAAAGLAVAKVGSSTVTVEEVLTEYSMSPGLDRLAHKLVGSEEAARLVREHQRGGGRVVFTNGCFDILHAGHVDNLVRAAGLGDLLVVGLNSDASVRRLKGNPRPIVDQDARAQVLAGLESVDLVVVFEEDTPESLIGVLQPDVLVKGEDYAGKPVAGEDIVLARGGSLELLPLKAGLSTTTIINRILGSR